MSPFPPPPTRWLRLLPLLLLAAMVAIALTIEAALLDDGGSVQWGVKLPLILLIATAWLHRRRSSS